MHPAAIMFLVSAALAHAGWNLFAKRVPDGGAIFVWLTTACSSAILLPFGVWLAVRDGMSGVWWLAFAVSGVFHLGYFVLLQRGYRVGDLSVVYPLARGTGPLLSVVAAVWLLHERPGIVALLGAAAVVAGVLVIGGLRLGDGMVYGFAAGALIAGYTLWDAYAVTTLAVPPVVLMAGTTLGETVLLAPYAVARRVEVRRIWREYRAPVLVVAVLSPLAYVLVLFAMRLAPVSMVAPVRELSIVFGSLGAWLLLGEPNPVRRLNGAVIIVAGVAAIAVS